MNKRNKKKGFTLIEMIVVIAIIAVLVGLGVPQITKSIANSKKRTDIANARTIASMLQQKIAEGSLAKKSENEKTLIDKNLVGTDIPEVKYNEGYAYYYTFDGVDDLKIYIKVGSENNNDLYDQVYPNTLSSNKIYK